MEQQRLLRMMDLHAWVGVFTGLYIYIVCFSGIFSLFGQELRTWEDESLRIPLLQEPAAIMPTLSAFVEEMKAQGDLNDLKLLLPTDLHPFYQATAVVRLNTDHSFQKIHRRWHPQTLEPLPSPREGLVLWLVNFHRNFMLPRTWGRALVGLAGVLLLLSIFSGLVIHQKIIREFFTWRLFRSLRVKWQDSHKVLSIWGLPFHLMISFTGVWLGFLALLFPIVVAVSPPDQQDAIINELLGGGAMPPSGISAPLHSLDQARLELVKATGQSPASVVLINWGDETAQYKFHFPARYSLDGVETITLSATSGARLTPPPKILAHKVLPAMTSLHYGHYGGLWLKALYVLLGLALCLITATGLMIWIERRLHYKKGRYSPVFYEKLERLIIGVTLGMPLATFALFYVNKLLSLAPEQEIEVMAYSYFGVWFLAVFYAQLHKDKYRCCRSFFIASGVATMGLPLLNTAMTNQSLWGGDNSGVSFVTGADLTFGITGLFLLAISFSLPRERSETFRKIQRETAEQGQQIDAAG